MSDGTILLGVIVAVIGFAGAVTAAVVAARQKGLTDLVVALQAEVVSLRAEVADLRDERDVHEEYIEVLRQHIAEQKPPPPPARPRR